MTFRVDRVFDHKSGRHQLHCVNQRCDLLMRIAWDDGAGDYLVDGGRTSAEEARAIARKWGEENFDLDAQLERARTELAALDRRRRAG